MAFVSAYEDYKYIFEIELFLWWYQNVTDKVFGWM